MWSIWLVFCDCSFHSYDLWWIRTRGLRKFTDGRDWLWENMGLVLKGRAMLSAVQSRSTLCDPMDCGSPGSLVHHQFPELTQIHVHRVSDAIPPSHPLSCPSPSAFNLSQHQGLFPWVSSSNQVAKVLEFQLQSASVLPMNIQDWFPLGLTGLISLQSKGLSRVFSNTTVQKHWFFGTQIFL